MLYVLLNNVTKIVKVSFLTLLKILLSRSHLVILEIFLWVNFYLKLLLCELLLLSEISLEIFYLFTEYYIPIFISRKFRIFY